MIITLLYIVFFLSCVMLIASVLLQPGKSDAGALFTSSVSSTAFGPRGTASILSRITIGAAIAFMLSALLLAMPALRGDNSILQSTGIETTTPATTDANTAVNADTNSNSNTGNTNSPIINAPGPTGNTATNVPAAASESALGNAPAANANTNK